MNFKKTALSIALALAVIAPTAVYATSTKNDAPNSNTNLTEKKEQLKTTKEEKANTKEDKIQQKQEKLQARIARHEKVFQKADVIVPGTLAKGMAALNERVGLRTQIRDLKKEKIGTLVLPIKEKLKLEVAAIKAKLVKGEITKAEAEVQIQALQQVKKTEIQNVKEEFKKKYETQRAALQVKRETVRESYKNFTVAVKSKDAKTIEDTFNIYLQNLNELNIMLKGFINVIA